MRTFAPVAQLDRVPGYEPGGRPFDSVRARHFIEGLSVTFCNSGESFYVQIYLSCKFIFINIQFFREHFLKYKVVTVMQKHLPLTIAKLKSEFGEQHARIYELIAREDQVMSTYAIECASEMDPEIVALCLGDLVRSSFIKTYQKYGRRLAWETVKSVAVAS